MANLNVLERITTALSGICDLYYGVADTESYPFVIYSVESEPSYTKSGIYKYVCSVKFAICGKTFDEADAISGQLDTAVKALKAPDLRVIEGSCLPGPDDNNMWVVLREYTITQQV
jgi:hypothetical protein